jgi:malate dehydrogenase (oxaloacetate-decarboxylating)(NADP+)
VTQEYAKLEMRRRHTLIGAMMIKKGDADGMICGTFGTTQLHLHYIDQVLGRREGACVYAAMNVLMLPQRQLVMVDTHVNENPTPTNWPRSPSWPPRKCAASACRRAPRCCRTPTSVPNSASAQKMRAALELVKQRDPSLEVDGEMHGDTALDSKLRNQIMPARP